jgi:hypothetical protein
VTEIEVPNIIAGQEKNITKKKRFTTWPARNCDVLDLPNRPIHHPTDDIHGGLGARAEGGATKKGYKRKPWINDSDPGPAEAADQTPTT